MAESRKELEVALWLYTTETLGYIDTVRGFCEMISKWMLRRETELSLMMNIKDRADKLDLNIKHVIKSESKGKAFMEYMESILTRVLASSRRKKLQKELADVLKDTLGGLEKLDCFLDAVEKLAVTSLHVFMENQVLHLPGLKHVQDIINAARVICPLLIEFKRDAEVFFSPRLQYVAVLSYQLARYIQNTKKIFDELEKSSFSKFRLKNTMETVVDLDVDLSEDDMQRMLCHIKQLDEIRMDPHFRMVFLFQEEACSNFIREFSMRQPRMLQFLKELEENAVQLDRMNKGAKISSVAGSSVGAAGNVLFIIGLALTPVTAGVSLGLTMAGIGMGITSGVNGIVTDATEFGVNIKHQIKANEVLQSFIEDVQCLQDCLEEATKREVSEIDVVVAAGKVFWKACSIVKGTRSVVDAASDAKMLNSENEVASAGQVVAQEANALRNVPRMASDIPDIGQAAFKGPLALTKIARAGQITLAGFFFAVNIFFICKDSISLAKGSDTEESQFIRAGAALWRSEMDSWQKIHDSLIQGLLTSEKKQGVLETPFYLKISDEVKI